MRNITGAIAEGPDFFDRINEMTRLWDKLKTDNVLLLAPRRVGKTSLMKQMARNAGDYGFNPLYVDVSDCADELRFVERLYSSILSHDTTGRYRQAFEESWLAKTLKSVQKVGGYGVSLEFKADAPSWQVLGEELTKMIAKLGDQWLLQIDELPVFVLKLLDDGSSEGRARVRQFLYWLRRVRLGYPVRWMLAGSIGLDTVAARINVADAINDLHIEKLGAFSIETATAFLRDLARAYEKTLDEETIDRILTRVGVDWLVPYYLQLVFNELRNLPGLLGRLQVDQEMESLLGPHHRNYFDYWRQRLTEELGAPEANHALLLLNACCYSEHGASRQTLSAVLSRWIADATMREERLRYLLDVLQNDGYMVEPRRGEWRFISPLLREYWLLRVAPPQDFS